jgi:hypothetical protein
MKSRDIVNCASKIQPQYDQCNQYESQKYNHPPRHEWNIHGIFLKSEKTKEVFVYRKTRGKKRKKEIIRNV